MRRTNDGVRDRHRTRAAPAAGFLARSWRWLREHVLHIYAGLAVVYILTPIVVIAVFSFADAPRRTGFVRDQPGVHARVLAEPLRDHRS